MSADVGQRTLPGGHAVARGPVEMRVSTIHFPQETRNHRRPDDHQPAQCLRHHVWMASCADCRDARPLPKQRAARGR